MTNLLLLLLPVTVFMLWREHRKVQEIVVAHCRRTCEAAGVQFLDDVAPVWRVRIARDARGTARLRRVFTFDYSTPLGDRRLGTIVMLGRTPIAIHLEQSDERRPDHLAS
jgi:hypothetical protein